MTSKDCWNYNKKKYKGTGVTFNKIPPNFVQHILTWMYVYFITMGNTVFNSNSLGPTEKHTLYIEIVGNRKV